MAIGDITTLEWTTDCELQPSVMANLLSEMEILFDSWVDQLQPIIQVNSPTEPIVAEWVAAWQQQGGEGDIPSNGSFRWSDTSQLEKEYTREYNILESGGVNPVGQGGEAMPGTVTRIRSAVISALTAPTSPPNYANYAIIEFDSVIREGYGIISFPLTYDNNIVADSDEWLRFEVEVNGNPVPGYTSPKYAAEVMHSVGRGIITALNPEEIKQAYLLVNVGVIGVLDAVVRVEALVDLTPEPTIYDLSVLTNKSEHGIPGSYPLKVLLPFMQLLIYH